MDFVQLIPLQVIFPLTSALLIPILRYRMLNLILLFIGFISSFTICIILLYAIHENVLPISYHLGGWNPPFGIELKISFITELIVALISIIGLLSSIYTLYSMPREIKYHNHYSVNTCMLLVYTGMIGMLISNDVFNVYVFLELTSLATYALIASNKTKRALNASFDYLIIGTIGATFYLMGVGLLYGISGTLNMGDIAHLSNELYQNKAFCLGIIFIMSGLMLKSALFPLGNWMVKAYSSAPTFVTCFMSGTATKVSLYITLKYVYLVFGTYVMFEKMFFQELFICLGLAAIVYGSFAACKSNYFKMILSYSSIAQIGYIVLGIGLNSSDGLEFSIMQMIIHSITKVPLFMLCGLYFLQNNNDKLYYNNKPSNLSNLFIKFYAFFSLSLISIPFTSGFITKWMMLNIIFTHSNEIIFKFIFIVVILSSIFPLYYLGNIWKAINSNNETEHNTVFIPNYLKLTFLFMACINVFIGVFPNALSYLIKHHVMIFFL